VNKKLRIRSQKAVLNFLSNIPCINVGGCGISTLAIYRWLEKKNRLKNPKIVYLYRHSEKKHFESNQKHQGSTNQNFLKLLSVPNHVCLFNNGKYFDNNGTILLDDYKYIQHIDVETENGLQYLIDTIKAPADTWNSWFDRAEIPKIAERLNVKLF